MDTETERERDAKGTVCVSKMYNVQQKLESSIESNCVSTTERNTRKIEYHSHRTTNDVVQNKVSQ